MVKNARLAVMSVIVCEKEAECSTFFSLTTHGRYDSLDGSTCCADWI